MIGYDIDDRLAEVSKMIEVGVSLFSELQRDSKLVQLKLNIGASGGEFTPPEVETGGTPTYRSGRLAVG